MNVHRSTPSTARSLAGLTTVALGLLLAALHPVRSAGAAVPPPRPAGPAKVPARSTPVYLPTRGVVPTLPDSVVARVDDRVDITTRELGRAAIRLARTQKPDTLGAERRREILDVLVEKAVLSRRATRERWTWSREESTQYKVLRDRLTLSAALDSAEGRLRARWVARGDTLPSAEVLGMATRDSFVASLEPRFDTALLARVAVSFDTLPRPNSKMPILEQMRLAGAMPVIAADDLDRPIVTTREGAFTTRELVEGWGRLNPIYRPRVQSAADVADLARNGLFERELRRQAVVQRFEDRPEVARILAEQRELFAVTHYVQREVYDRIPLDSLTLRRHYQRHLDRWDLPPKAKTLEMMLPDRTTAMAMMERIRRGAEAESLQAHAERAGTSFLNEASPLADSMIYVFASREGPGAVMGPDSTLNGFRIIRVLSLEPSKRRTFLEARKLVEKDWTDVEAERRVRALLDRLRAQTRVVVDTRRLATAKLPDAPPRRIETFSR